MTAVPSRPCKAHFMACPAAGVRSSRSGSAHGVHESDHFWCARVGQCSARGRAEQQPRRLRSPFNPTASPSLARQLGVESMYKLLIIRHCLGAREVLLVKGQVPLHPPSSCNPVEPLGGVWCAVAHTSFEGSQKLAFKIDPLGGAVFRLPYFVVQVLLKLFRQEQRNNILKRSPLPEPDVPSFCR